MKPGDKVNQFDNICEVQSDKASVTITSRYDGIIKNLNFKVDESALVGSALLDIELESKDEEVSETNKNEIKSDSEILNSIAKSNDFTKDKEENSVKNVLASGKFLTTPAVRRIAIENNIDLSKVLATGKEGRIMKEDVLLHLKNLEEKDDKESLTVEKESIHLQEGPKIPPKLYMKHMWKSMTESLASKLIKMLIYIYFAYF